MVVKMGGSSGGVPRKALTASLLVSLVIIVPSCRGMSLPGPKKSGISTSGRGTASPRFYKEERDQQDDVLVETLIQKREQTLYEILGANESATKVELKKCYIRLAKTTHPDALIGNNGGDTSSCHNPNAPTFSEVAEAWKTLGDKKSRKRYDSELRAKRLSDQIQKDLDQNLEKAFSATADMMDNIGQAASMLGSFFQQQQQQQVKRHPVTVTSHKAPAAKKKKRQSTEQVPQQQERATTPTSNSIPKRSPKQTVVSKQATKTNPAVATEVQPPKKEVLQKTKLEQEAKPNSAETTRPQPLKNEALQNAKLQQPQRPPRYPEGLSTYEYQEGLSMYEIKNGIKPKATATTPQPTNEVQASTQQVEEGLSMYEIKKGIQAMAAPKAQPENEKQPKKEVETAKLEQEKPPKQEVLKGKATVNKPKPKVVETNAQPQRETTQPKMEIPRDSGKLKQEQQPLMRKAEVLAPEPTTKDTKPIVAAKPQSQSNVGKLKQEEPLHQRKADVLTTKPTKNDAKPKVEAKLEAQSKTTKPKKDVLDDSAKLKQEGPPQQRPEAVTTLEAKNEDKKPVKANEAQPQINAKQEADEIIQVATELLQKNEQLKKQENEAAGKSAEATKPQPESGTKQPKTGQRKELPQQRQEVRPTAEDRKAQTKPITATEREPKINAKEPTKKILPVAAEFGEEEEQRKAVPATKETAKDVKPMIPTKPQPQDAKLQQERPKEQRQKVMASESGKKDAKPMVAEARPQPQDAKLRETKPRTANRKASKPIVATKSEPQEQYIIKPAISTLRTKESDIGTSNEEHMEQNVMPSMNSSTELDAILEAAIAAEDMEFVNEKGMDKTSPNAHDRFRSSLEDFLNAPKVQEVLRSAKPAGFPEDAWEEMNQFCSDDDDQEECDVDQDVDFDVDQTLDVLDDMSSEDDEYLGYEDDYAQVEDFEIDDEPIVLQTAKEIYQKAILEAAEKLLRQTAEQSKRWKQKDQELNGLSLPRRDSAANGAASTASRQAPKYVEDHESMFDRQRFSMAEDLIDQQIASFQVAKQETQSLIDKQIASFQIAKKELSETTARVTDHEWEVLLKESSQQSPSRRTMRQELLHNDELVENIKDVINENIQLQVDQPMLWNGAPDGAMNHVGFHHTGPDRPHWYAYTQVGPSSRRKK